MKLAIASVTLFPVRLVLVLALLLVVIVLANIAAFGVHTRDLSKRPLAVWRLAVRAIALVLVRGIFFVCGFYWIKENGTPAPTSEAPVAISNHVCTSARRAAAPPLPFEGRRH